MCTTKVPICSRWVQKCTFWKGTAPVTAFVPFFRRVYELTNCQETPHLLAKRPIYSHFGICMLTSSQKKKKKPKPKQTQTYTCTCQCINTFICLQTIWNNTPLTLHKCTNMAFHSHKHTHTHTPPPIKGDPRTIASVPQRLHKSRNMRVLV